MYHFSSTIIFNTQPKLTLILSFLKNLEVLFYKYITAFLKPGVENFHSVEKSFSTRWEKNHFLKIQ